jgi:hypothetical protein
MSTEALRREKGSDARETSLGKPQQKMGVNDTPTDIHEIARLYLQLQSQTKSENISLLMVELFTFLAATGTLLSVWFSNPEHFVFLLTTAALGSTLMPLSLFMKRSQQRLQDIDSGRPATPALKLVARDLCLPSVLPAAPRATSGSDAPSELPPGQLAARILRSVAHPTESFDHPS